MIVLWPVRGVRDVVVFLCCVAYPMCGGAQFCHGGGDAVPGWRIRKRVPERGRWYGP